MKIRGRLTFKYAAITAAIFFIFMAVIYYVGEHLRSDAFFRNLRTEAITKAHLFLNNQVDAQTMQSIYLNNRQFIDEVEVAIYSPDFKMIYHDSRQNDIVKETPVMINDILKHGEIQFYENDYQAIGLVYDFDGKKYIVTAAAYDRYGYANQLIMRNILIVLSCSGLSILIIVGFILARSSLMPIRSIVKEADKIGATQINKRLPVKNEKDELGELSTTFNALLDRLEKTFNAQKMFVSNVSHELRTPMAALSAELDLSLQKERTVEQYQKSINNALQDSGRIIKLIDGLLNIAKADYQSEQIKTEEIRLDELLLDANELVKRAHADYHIELIFEDEAEDETELTVVANPYLLTTAFVNLIENNCKYSDDKTSYVQISTSPEYVTVRLSDNGIGISDSDKEHIFELFYRGNNSEQIQGHGIGMALTQKIVTLYKGKIEVESIEGKGTTYTVMLPHL